MITLAQQKSLMEAIRDKASNNSEKQAYIKPSEFGFTRSTAGTEECIKFLEHQPQVLSAKFIGKDSVDVILR